MMQLPRCFLAHGKCLYCANLSLQLYEYRLQPAVGQTTTQASILSQSAASQSDGNTSTSYTGSLSTPVQEQHL